jgi:type III secretion system FlhB-like substrate exporter
MKLLIKLVIAALVANALYRVGAEYLTYIKFRDAVRDAAMFKARTDDELRARIMVLAEEYDIPLYEETVSIQRENRLVSVDAPYQKAIEVLPRYAVNWPFDVAVEVQVSSGVLLPGAPPPR